MKFTELQKKMQLKKSKNKMVSYSSRSAEEILDKFKSIEQDEWKLFLTDDIIEVAGKPYFKATANIVGKDESYLTEHVQALSEPPKGKSGAFTMSLPQWYGAISSYARKYALQGLFAMGEEDFDQMPDSVTRAVQSAEDVKYKAVVKRAVEVTGKPESEFLGLTIEEITKKVKEG